MPCSVSPSATRCSVYRSPSVAVTLAVLPYERVLARARLSHSSPSESEPERHRGSPGDRSPSAIFLSNGLSPYITAGTQGARPPPLTSPNRTARNRNGSVSGNNNNKLSAPASACAMSRQAVWVGEKIRFSEALRVKSRHAPIRRSRFHVIHLTCLLMLYRKESTLQFHAFDSLGSFTVDSI